MNIFDMAFKEVLGFEGGYVDNKNDNGFQQALLL